MRSRAECRGSEDGADHPGRKIHAKLQRIHFANQAYLAVAVADHQQTKRFQFSQDQALLLNEEFFSFGVHCLEARRGGLRRPAGIEQEVFIWRS